MNKTRDIAKVRLHDGIVGLLNIGSIVLASELGFNWIYIAVAVACKTGNKSSYLPFYPWLLQYPVFLFFLSINHLLNIQK